MSAAQVKLNSLQSAIHFYNIKPPFHISHAKTNPA